VASFVDSHAHLADASFDADRDEVLERARRTGARVLLDPREGPAGWRSIVASPVGGEIALWQPKDWR
jgi:predicted enzyme related to lactoylglutathione lyase